MAPVLSLYSCQILILDGMCSGTDEQKVPTAVPRGAGVGGSRRHGARVGRGRVEEDGLIITGSEAKGKMMVGV